MIYHWYENRSWIREEKLLIKCSGVFHIYVLKVGKEILQMMIYHWYGSTRWDVTYTRVVVLSIYNWHDHVVSPSLEMSRTWQNPPVWEEKSSKRWNIIYTKIEVSVIYRNRLNMQYGSCLKCHLYERHHSFGSSCRIENKMSHTRE